MFRIKSLLNVFLGAIFFSGSSMIISSSFVFALKPHFSNRIDSIASFLLFLRLISFVFLLKCLFASCKACLFSSSQSRKHMFPDSYASLSSSLRALFFCAYPSPVSISVPKSPLSCCMWCTNSCEMDLKMSFGCLPSTKTVIDTSAGS